MKVKRAVHLPISHITRSLGSLELPPQELQSFVAALARRTSRILRYRRGIDLDRLPFSTETVDWYALARRVVDDSMRPSRHITFAAGDYYLQDAGSLLALALARADTDSLAGGFLICDLCAAPGGKASALLEAIADRGFVLANEPIRSRVPPLAYNLARTGSDRFAVSSLDPEQLADRLGSVFDLVLVDAPCSGQALLGRSRQSASALSPKQIEHSAARQRRILAAAMRLLREGGQLVYSTCTFAEAENEAQIRWLIDHSMAQPAPLGDLAHLESSAAPASYRLWPHRHDCEGSFAASLRSMDDPPEQRKPQPRRDVEPPPIDVRQWFDAVDRLRLRSMDSIMIGWPSDAPDWAEEVAVTGPEVAHRTGQTWKPAHAAALRRLPRAVSRQKMTVELDVAQRLLAGESIPCEFPGWQVVCYQDRPLGWVKGVGAVGKNHLPAAARICGISG